MLRFFIAVVMAPVLVADVNFTYVDSCYNPSLSANTYQTIPRLSITACGILCARDHRCESFSVKQGDEDFTCYLNSDRRQEDGECSDRAYRHFNGDAYKCQNDGMFINETYGCRCFHGYIGKWCERLMQDCSEGHYTDHYTGEEGLFYIQPNTSLVKYKVFCNMVYKGKTYFMRRELYQPEVDFARPWEEYKHGFGDLENGNHWAGLEMLHRVTTNRDHKLVVIAFFQDYESLHWRQHFYNVFKAYGEEDLYKFIYSSSTENFWDTDDRGLMDGLVNSLGVPFSTYDKDNSGSNCPNISQSGWWFNGCHKYNPTGQPQPLSVVNQTGDPTSLTWPHADNKAPVKIDIYLEVD